MKVILSGSRYFNDYEALDGLLSELRPPITKIVVGDAKGLDTVARVWAVKNEVPVMVYRADWELNGKAAGSIRDNDLLRDHYNASMVIAFPDREERPEDIWNLVQKAVRDGLHVVLPGTE